jgi:Na+/melibiose symporter-like transporter
MIGADVGCAFLLASVPLTAAAGMLRIEQLHVASLLFSMLVVGFSITKPIVPADVVATGAPGGGQQCAGRQQLGGVGCRSRYRRPSGAGADRIALLVDAVSYLCSAVFLGLIRAPRSQVSPPRQRRPLYRDVGDGFGLVLGNPILRPLPASSATFVFFLQFFSTLRILYLVREIGIGPATIGVIATIGAAGGLLGALLAARMAGRFGLGPIMVVGVVMSGVGALMVPLAGGPLATTLAILAFGEVLDGFGGATYNINALSLRQAITPDQLQGRINATMRFLSTSATPVGALLAGVLVGVIGVRTALAIAAVGMILAGLWVFFSPLRGLVQAPSGSSKEFVAITSR